MAKKAKLDNYLKGEGERDPKTVRASKEVWTRVRILAGRKDVKANEVIVALIEKGLDEEGV